ncbi:methionine synthase [Corynebacterium sp. NPDC060344]|uniref:methionine synthase n=1 Tax=Corynebacterium sp. NPDC060344 TaxID=3347101 RepID=UPI0036669AB8
MTAFRGLGPLPGTDVRAVAEILAGECGAHPHLPVLADRGLGADAVGRTGAICADLGLDAGPRSWRIAERGGRAVTVAADHLERDLDVCEEFWGTAPETVTVPVVGPWTLAAAIELPGGHRMLVDRGAVAYLAASLAEGLAAHVADVRGRFGAEVDVVMHEPAAPAIAAGLVEGAIEGTTLPAVGYRELAEQWRTLTGGAAGLPPITIALPGLAAAHPGPRPPSLEKALLESGAAGIALPIGAISGSAMLDEVGRLRQSGLDLLLGAVPATPGGSDEHTGAHLEPDARAIAERVARLWDELSFPRADLVGHVGVTVDRGFAGAPASWIAPAYAGGRRTAELISRAAGDL